MERVVVVEMNLGQYFHEVRRVLGGRRADFHGEVNSRQNGRPADHAGGNLEEVLRG